MDVGHPFIDSLDKKIRNLNKKLKEIQELKQKRNTGTEMNPEQLEKLKHKDEINAQIENINKYKQMFTECMKDEKKKQEKQKKDILKDETKKHQDQLQQLVHLFKGFNEIDHDSTIYPKLLSIKSQLSENPRKALEAFLHSELPENIAWILETQQVSQNLKDRDFKKEQKGKEVKTKVKTEVKTEVKAEEKQEKKEEKQEKKEERQEMKLERQERPKREQRERKPKEEGFKAVGKVQRPEKEGYKPSREPYKKLEQ